MTRDATRIFRNARRTRAPSIPPIRRDSRYSSRPALTLAAIAVPSARPRNCNLVELSQMFRIRLTRMLMALTVAGVRAFCSE